MRRNEAFVICIALAMDVGSSAAATRASSSYSIGAETEDVAGQRTSSVQYRIDGSVGGIGGLSGVASPPQTAKHGYIGQLYEIVGLTVSAPPSPNLAETAARQLVAALSLDDTTTLAALDPSTVAWSILTGPVSSISAGGMATAGTVYQDSPATVQGAAQALSGQLTLTVLNVNNDNFGPYAGDGIDDSWQVQYFGQNNPNAFPGADPDGDGQTNLFEWTAGLIPNDQNSRFLLRVVPGALAGARNLIFNPLAPGRTYTVQFKTDLLGADWNALTGTSQSDNGAERTVTDLNAGGQRKFYRVQISKP